MTHKQQHISQALVSAIILLPCSSVQTGPFHRNERQSALSQGFRGWPPVRDGAFSRDADDHDGFDELMLD